MILLEELIFMRDFVILFFKSSIAKQNFIDRNKTKERERRKRGFFPSHSLTHFFDHLSEKKIIVLS